MLQVSSFIFCLFSKNLIIVKLCRYAILAVLYYDEIQPNNRDRATQYTNWINTIHFETTWLPFHVEVSSLFMIIYFIAIFIIIEFTTI